MKNYTKYSYEKLQQSLKGVITCEVGFLTCDCWEIGVGESILELVSLFNEKIHKKKFVDRIIYFNT